MHQSHSAREFSLARRSISPGAVAITALVFAVACHDDDGLHFLGASGGAGMDGAFAGQGGASGSASAGSAGSTAGSSAIAGSAGSGGVAGGVSGSAGSTAGSSAVAGSGGAGGVGGSAGSAGSGGVAGSAGSGGSGQTSNCAAGGALFVVGNYADPAGNQFMLRSAPKAATFALVPAGVANPAKPPQLFLVTRVCAPGGALIASDGSANYRVDFLQSGSELAVCWSAAVPTLEAALALPPADASHSASTGCAGRPFAIYTGGAL